ncbi:MAG TPA: DUF2934 domain-containing protein [Gallionella sp.]
MKPVKPGITGNNCLQFEYLLTVTAWRNMILRCKGFVWTNVVIWEISIMVEETKKPAVKKAVASKAVAPKAVVTKTPAVKAPAAKKAAVKSAVWPFPEVEKVVEAKKAPAKPAPAKTVAVKAVAKPAKKQTVAQPSAQERYRMVETAAYYIAERSGFQGCTTKHWAEADLEIAKKLNS